MSSHAAGKPAGGHYVRSYALKRGVDGVSFRYFNFFGPRQDPSSSYSGVISLFDRAMSGGLRPVTRFDGRYDNNFTCFANVVKANPRTLGIPGRLGGEAVKAGIGQKLSLLDLIAAINVTDGTDSAHEFRPVRAGDVRDSQVSLEKARDPRGYEPGAGFEVGLRKTLGVID